MTTAADGSFDELGPPLVLQALRATDYDYEEAAQLLQAQADSGDADALHALAEFILIWHINSSIKGTPTYTLEEAWALFRRAAEADPTNEIAHGLGYRYE